MHLGVKRFFDRQFLLPCIDLCFRKKIKDMVKNCTAITLPDGIVSSGSVIKE